MGVDTQADNYIAKRLQVCAECRYYAPLTKSCSVCKCFMPLKARMAKTRCPIQKWGREDNSEVQYGEALRR